MHSQVQAVETMIEQQNNGQGWGVPVAGGIVLTEQLLQKVFFRLALIGATIKACLDSELGFAKEVAGQLRHGTTS